MTGHAASSRCDPVTYGARHDGRTNDGPAIQRAITVCSEAGGGIEEPLVDALGS
ncbi:hypothetical protein [Gluconobacter sp.]|uniref:hypothetical protein n=1 Tax=Gluconobacter sp. TaxID=1876758 RepID=UPI000B307DCA